MDLPLQQTRNPRQIFAYTSPRWLELAAPWRRTSRKIAWFLFPRENTVHRELRCCANSGKHVHRPDSKTTNKRSSRMITAKRWKGAHVNFDTFVFPFSTKRKRSVRRSNELWLREPSRGDAALPQTRSRLLVGFRRMKGRDGGDAGGYLYKPDYPSLSVPFPWTTCTLTTLR